MRPLRPSDSPYFQANCAAHEVRWGIALPAGHPADDVAVDTVASASDDRDVWPRGEALRAQLAVATHVWHRLHSERRPVEESQAWIRASLPDDDQGPVAVVIGAGLGYAVEQLLAHPGRRVLVLEPVSGLIGWMLARRDWTTFISGGRLMILPGPRYDAVARALPFLRGAEHTTPRVLTHPVVARARPEAVERAHQEVQAALHGARANAVARRRFEAPYLLNTLGNLSRVLRHPGVDTLAGRSSGQPVVIAGAGPSLNRNIDELRPWRRDVVLVASDTALRPLLDANMAPDFVVAVDPGPLNARHLTNLIVDPSTTLVAESSVDADAFEAFGDNVCTFRIADHAPWPWLLACGVDRGRLRAWGSVLTTSFDLALHMGGDPVVFIGADLSFTANQPYCRGTTYEQDWARAGAERGVPLSDVWEGTIASDPRTADDIDGAPARTASHLIAFRDWIVRAAGAAGGHGSSAMLPRVVNATGAGILHGPGVDVAPLSEVLPLVTTAAVVPRASLQTDRHTQSTCPPLTMDAHLLHYADRWGVSFPSTAGVAPTPTPYMQRTRRDRAAATRGLRVSRQTDTTRWFDPDNLDRAWDRRVVAAAALIPAGLAVLDLGAGRQTLARHLPPETTYLAADLVPRTPETIVVDVNAGQYPDAVADVVVALGLLEHVHDVRQLLDTAAHTTPMLVTSYCAMTRWHREVRLEKGWLNDFRLSDLVDLFAETGWRIAWAGRLDQLAHFDQWIVVARSARNVRRCTGRSDSDRGRTASSAQR